MTTMEEKPLHVQQAEGLRKLADAIENRPEFAHAFRYAFSKINIFPNDEDPAGDMANLIRLGLAAGATVAKSASDQWMTATLSFGSAVKVDINAARAEVCTRREVGTEVRKVREYVEIEKEVPVYEWDCHPLLAGGAS